MFNLINKYIIKNPLVHIAGILLFDGLAVSAVMTDAAKNFNICSANSMLSPIIGLLGFALSSSIVIGSGVAYGLSYLYSRKLAAYDYTIFVFIAQCTSILLLNGIALKTIAGATAKNFGICNPNSIFSPLFGWTGFALSTSVMVGSFSLFIAYKLSILLRTLCTYGYEYVNSYAIKFFDNIDNHKQVFAALKILQVITQLPLAKYLVSSHENNIKTWRKIVNAAFKTEQTLIESYIRKVLSSKPIDYSNTLQVLNERVTLYNKYLIATIQDKLLYGQYKYQELIAFVTNRIDTVKHIQNFMSHTAENENKICRTNSCPILTAFILRKNHEAARNTPQQSSSLPETYLSNLRRVKSLNDVSSAVINKPFPKPRNLVS